MSSLLPDRLLTWLPTGRIDRFTNAVLAHDFPQLPPSRRDEVRRFVARRAARLPAPMHLGVAAVAAVTGVAAAIAGVERTVGLLDRVPLPLAGEYLRLVRSLAYAYIWETWPDTAADGAPLP
ncbi:hypothetical protein [Desertimonas flava]|uniref:hypothetical protein n=1 Tax=Desertimonas flava TaxID=2064846 RepID=UPI000E3573D3|nr:hypothetical protein [Desertimonas flava]